MAAELLDSGDMKAKMAKLNPELQGLFMHYLREMYDQESNSMIDLIGEGRRDLQKDALEYSPTPESPNGKTKTITHSRSISRNSSRGPKIPPIDDLDNKLAVERYMKKRDREKTIHKTPRSPYPSQISVNAYETPRLTRDYSSIPGTPESNVSEHSLYEEETQEILRDMTHATARIENERDRQAEMVKRMKEKKRAKQEAHEAMVNDILEKAGDSEMAKKKDKERQEQKIRERLEEKKRQAATPDVLFVDIDKADGDGENQASNNKDKKKKKKRKKDKDKNTNEEEEHSDKEKKKKKKKKKKKEKDLENEDDETEGHKKHKKKKKDKTENEDDEADSPKEEKKKKKKKKKDKEKDKEMSEAEEHPDHSEV